MTKKHIGAFHRSMSFVFYSKQYSDEHIMLLFNVTMK